MARKKQRDAVNDGLKEQLHTEGLREALRGKKERAKLGLFRDVRHAHNQAHQRQFVVRSIMDELFHIEKYTSQCVKEILEDLQRRERPDQNSDFEAEEMDDLRKQYNKDN